MKPEEMWFIKCNDKYLMILIYLKGNLVNNKIVIHLKIEVGKNFLTRASIAQELTLNTSRGDNKNCLQSTGNYYQSTHIPHRMGETLYSHILDKELISSI